MRLFALALMLIGAGPPRWFGPAFAPPAAVDVPCAVKARAAEEDHHFEETVPVAALPWDLDGDQKVDVFAVHGCGATGNCTGLVYLSSLGCQRSVGTVSGVRFERLAQRSFGVAGLSSFHRFGCAGQSGVITDWKWDGHAFRQTGGLTCFCGDEPDAKPNSPRCSPQ
jgi:hypothetical protein